MFGTIRHGRMTMKTGSPPDRIDRKKNWRTATTRLQYSSNIEAESTIIKIPAAHKLQIVRPLIVTLNSSAFACTVQGSSYSSTGSSLAATATCFAIPSSAGRAWREWAPRQLPLSGYVLLVTSTGRCYCTCWGMTRIDIKRTPNRKGCCVCTLVVNNMPYT